MTESTSLALIEKLDGSIVELNGVVYAEQAIRTEDNTAGVAVQYGRDPSVQDEPETDFVEHGNLIGIYDEICEDAMDDSYYTPITEM